MARVETPPEGIPNPCLAFGLLWCAGSTPAVSRIKPFFSKREYFFLLGGSIWRGSDAKRLKRRVNGCERRLHFFVGIGGERLPRGSRDIEKKPMFGEVH
jgi:hypothetical protein